MMSQLLILVFISCLSSTVAQSVALTRSEIRSTSFIIEWNPQDWVNYKISIVEIGSSADAASALAATPPYEVTSTVPAGALITPDTKYDIYLYKDQFGSFAKVGKIPGLVTASAAPSNVRFTNVQSTQFQVHWDHANDGQQEATKYKVYYQTGGTTKTKNTVGAGARSLTITGLTPNSDYSVTVVGWKNSQIFTDESDPPALVATFSKPTSVTLTPSSSSSIDVTWHAPVVSGGGSAIIAGYKISWTPPHNSGVKTVTGTAISDQITGLNGNTAYSVTVAAMSSASGAGALSDSESAATGIAKPTALTTGDSTSSTIDVTWTKSPSGGSAVTITGYVLTWTPATGSGSMTATTDGSTPTPISGLNSNTEYTIQVTATSGSGNGDKSDAVKGTTAFSQPTSTSATGSSSSTINVTWSSPPVGGGANSIDGYTVSWSTGVESPSTRDVGASPYTIPSLSPNTEYSISVLARSAAGDGDKSGATGTTVPLQASQPTNSSNPTINSITIEWTRVSGNSPSLRYNVEWNPSGSTGSSTSVVENSTTIGGLTASTRYSFTVTAVNDGGSAYPSDPAMFFTLPNRTDFTNLTRPSTNSTTQINVEWNKPSGGDDIVDYVVDWWLSSSDGSMTSSGIVTGVTTSSYTIEGLTPGETYDVTVKARNSAGAGQPSYNAQHTTNPDSVKNVSITQNSTSPEKLLDLTWETTNGTGDSITIEYNGTNSNVTENISVDFSLLQTTLSVVPGNTYAVVFTVYSNGVTSEQVYDYANSKPSEPSFDVEASTNELLVTWTAPEGYYDGLTILLDGKKAIEVEDGNSEIIDGLDPYTDYTVEIYSWITNVKGEMERSRTSPKSYKTLPGPPPVLSPDSSLTEDAESSANAITFVLPPNTFSEKNGPIEYYAVYLSIGDQEKSVPDVTSFPTCQDLASSDECVTLWTDSEGNPASQGNENIIRDLDTSTRQSAPINFLIGNNTETYSPLNEPFISYPLQPNTGYRVAVAAKTANKQMTATVWGSEIKTIRQGGSDSIGLIIGVVCGAIVLVIAIVGGIYYYKRRSSQNKDQLSSNRSSFENFSKSSNQLVSKQSKKSSRRSIPKSDFSDVMRRMKETSYSHLTEEFEELKNVGVDQSTSEATTSENYTKNRYKKNILPYDVTRVKLQMIGDEPGTDFIHANYIPGYNKEKEFIATQGPLPTTKEDFWRMIWEQNSRTIVMLTQIVEGERVKCDHYWPYNKEPVVMAGITIQMLVEPQDSQDWIHRELVLTKGFQQRLVTHLHYVAWPDHGVPDTAENLVKFVRYVRNISGENLATGPTTVHCSAGVGRTGTFIAMDRLLQHMKDHDYVDIFGIVHEMRMCRVAMVQTDSQYILLHKMVQDVINETSVGEPVYENTTQSPIYENATFSGLHADSCRR